MQKDVIYIDVDDDITAVIGKVKAAKHKIVALVPPKRTGMLQSAVNLRLIHKAAEENDRRIVLISNNHQLAALAGVAGIPVAKTLQSKPELAQTAASDVDEGEEVIDGSQLAVGEHAKQAGDADAEADGSAAAQTKSAVGAAALSGSKASEGVASTDKKAKKKPKVPNFNAFRKRLLLVATAAALLVALLVWAFVFVPRATVIVTTRTTDVSISQLVTIGDNLTTSVKDSALKAERQTVERNISQEFSVTGKKDIGEKATGSVTLANNTLSDITIESGTALETSGGLTYYVSENVTIPRGSVSCVSIFNCSGTAGSAGASVAAAEPGEKYNAATGSLDGVPSGVSASFTAPTSGGTTKIVKVATDDDIKKSLNAARNDIDKNGLKADLLKNFGDEYILVADSFAVDTSDLQSSIDPGQEAKDGTASIKGSVTATLYAIKKSELKTYLEQVITKQIEGTERRVYSSGVEEVAFTNVRRSDDTITASLTTVGTTGPSISEEQIKQQSRGKKYGEVKQAIEAVDGIRSVDVEFPAFWVRTVPENDDKITVEFIVDDE